MTGPIFFFILLALVVILPALGGWFIAKKYEMGIRFFGTALGGQVIILPFIMFVTLSNKTNSNDSTLKTIIIYASMALVISIMTFAIMEMRKVRSNK